jgi:SAM-dependent methyltransferase
MKEQLPPGPVLDVGAGTGILSGQLGRAGFDVWAAEPSVPMLEQLVLSRPSGRGRSRGAACAAEALPFARGSFASVAAAQAFHWFEASRALSEFDRVLAPNGMVALVWNFRDEGVPWVRQLTDLIEERSGGRPVDAAAADSAEEAVRAEGIFELVRSAKIPNPQSVDLELLAGRIRSTSFVAGMPAGGQDSLVDAASGLVQESIGVSGGDRFEFPHVCRVQLFSRSR